MSMGFPGVLKEKASFLTESQVRCEFHSDEEVKVVFSYKRNRPQTELTFKAEFTNSCLLVCLFVGCGKPRKSSCLNPYTCFFKKMNPKTSVNRIVEIVGTDISSMRHPFGQRQVCCVHKICTYI